MSLTRIWANGVSSMPVSAVTGNPYLASADLSLLDGNFQSALDKSYLGDTQYGAITLGAGGKVSLDSPTSKFVVNANSTTSTGGRFQCGHGDFPVLSPGISVIPFFSLGEMLGTQDLFSSFWPISQGALNFTWYLDPVGSMHGGTNLLWTKNSAAVIPITRSHDGVVISGFTLKFTVSAGRTNLPVRYPGLNVFQYDPFLNTFTSITGGWNYFPTAGSLAGYKNGGIANFFTAPCTSTMNVGKYLYFATILDDDYDSEAPGTDWNEFVCLRAEAFGTPVTRLSFQ
jgi:hypothetical protein